MGNFKEFNKEILKRAKKAEACNGEYRRAYHANDFSELMQVIKDNFSFACKKNVIDAELITLYQIEFSSNQIYANSNIQSGYLLASGNATVEAWGNATVEASGNATVKAWNNATVEAWGNATVKAWNNATVEASGNATVKASGNATVKAWGNATVEASGNAYTQSYSIIECKLSDNAIYRVRSTNEIFTAKVNNLTIKEQII